MKTAYELAMERLEKREGRSAPLTAEQKAAVAEAEAELKARVAEVEILTGGRMAEAAARGDVEAVRKLEEEKRIDLARARARAEQRRAEIRGGAGRDGGAA